MDKLKLACLLFSFPNFKNIFWLRGAIMCFISERCISIPLIDDKLLVNWLTIYNLIIY